MSEIAKERLIAFIFAVLSVALIIAVIASFHVINARRTLWLIGG